MDGTNTEPCTRRRRVCSVVPPKLGVEHLETGTRTVVVGCNDVCHDSKDSISLHNQDATNITDLAKGCQEELGPQPAFCESGKAKGNQEMQRGKASFSTIPTIDADRGCAVTGNKRQVRKTQRSMSAYSVALPAPDCSILKDCLSGKIYRRGKLLGKGGFAKVYEGLEVSSGKKFALKIFDKSRLTFPLQRDRMRKEVEMHITASESSHPNIAKFETMFENSRSLCLVLELCESRSLAQHLRRRGILSGSEVSDILWQIVCGLYHIHGCGILHRDLKLGNILLSGDTVKIADFGLATSVSWAERKTICGTPNFIAPEVLQRQGHSAEADVWALGCILYTMLVGKPPFESTSLKDTYKLILRNCYTVPSSISDEAVDLIQWMLGAKPQNRPCLYDVLNHVFFIKHNTHTRFPSIDELSRVFPYKKVNTECPLPQRRRSTAPKPNTELRCSSSYVGGLEVRNNSCSAGFSPFSTVVPNYPSYSTGPRISLNHVGRVWSVENIGDKGEADITADSTGEAGGGCAMPNIVDVSVPRIDEKQTRPTDENRKSEKPLNGTQKSFRSDARKLEKRTKYSPVKMLASKLQKLRILSPKSCLTRTVYQSKAKAKGRGNGISSNTSAPVMGCPATWITKWVDYSNKYGFGYQLSNGKVCVLFNNGAHIALLPGGRTVEYIESNRNGGGCRTVFNVQTPPSAQEEAVKILMFFVTYMDKNLRHGSTDAAEIRQSQTDCTRMLTWSRTVDRVAMYISDGTLQVNFCGDHTKINISNIHENSSMRVTFVNKNGEVTSYGSNQLLNSGLMEVRRRLNQAHEEFHHLIEKEHCVSHPFCTIFEN